MTNLPAVIPPTFNIPLVSPYGSTAQTVRNTVARMYAGIMLMGVTPGVAPEDLPKHRKLIEDTLNVTCKQR